MKYGPSIWSVSMDASLHGETVFELVLSPHAVMLKKVGPHDGEPPHEHVLIDLDGKVLEFDVAEFASINVELEELPADFGYGGWAAGPMMTKSAKQSKVILTGGHPCHQILWEAEKLHGGETWPAPDKVMPGAYVPKTPKKKLPGAYFVGEPAPPKPPPLVEPPHVSMNDLPWKWSSKMMGSAHVEVSAWVKSETEAVVVRAFAWPKKGVKYVAAVEVSGYVAAENPHAIDDAVAEVIAKALHDLVFVESAESADDEAASKAAWTPEGQVAGMASFASTMKAVKNAAALTVMGLEDFKKAMESALIEQLAPQPMVVSPGQYKELAKLYGMIPKAGSVQDYKDAAADHDLEARVVPNYPAEGCVLVALFKFDGRPAEWEECAAVQKSVEEWAPVGSQPSCVPLTAELAKELAEIESELEVPYSLGAANAYAEPGGLAEFIGSNILGSGVGAASLHSVGVAVDAVLPEGTAYLVDLDALKMPPPLAKKPKYMVKNEGPGDVTCALDDSTEGGLVLKAGDWAHVDAFKAVFTATGGPATLTWADAHDQLKPKTLAVGDQLQVDAIPPPGDYSPEDFKQQIQKHAGFGLGSFYFPVGLT